MKYRNAPQPEKDAPSGTAIRTAELMEQKRPQFATDNLADEVETLPGSRGGCRPSGIRIHSLRFAGGRGPRRWCLAIRASC
ncbi:MAG: hypothetical protein R2857_03850 [Vampirovibrionales bacterium]